MRGSLFRLDTGIASLHDLASRKDVDERGGMSSQHYVIQPGAKKPEGPYSKDEIKARIRDGRLSPDAKVNMAGTEE